MSIWIEKIVKVRILSPSNYPTSNEEIEEAFENIWRTSGDVAVRVDSISKGKRVRIGPR